jgi:hypothetical protein
MGLPRSVDVVPLVFSGTSLGIFGDVSSFFPFPASDSFVSKFSASCEGIPVSFILPLVFVLSCIFVSKPRGGHSYSGDGVVASPYKFLGKHIHLWLWNDAKPICVSSGKSCTLFNTSSQDLTSLNTSSYTYVLCS